jgi:tetratricopeptide (TPR) repeat protein
MSLTRLPPHGRHRRPQGQRRPRRSLALLLPAALVPALLLGGCGALPGPSGAPQPGQPGQPAADQPEPALEGYLQQQRKLAEQAQAQGRWADAALAWEVIGLLQPGDAAAREQLAAVRQQIDRLRARHAAAALAAQQRGQLDAAQQAWLQVLALEPRDAAAAAALRQIERERSSRAQLGRFARAAAPARPARSAPAASPDANSEREHATLLAQQGDLDGALALLRENPRWRNLAAHRALVVELLVRKAQAQAQAEGETEAARKTVDAALALDPKHAAARALRTELGAAADAAQRRAPAPRPTSQ